MWHYALLLFIYWTGVIVHYGTLALKTYPKMKLSLPVSIAAGLLLSEFSSNAHQNMASIEVVI
jgi:hypothetical protein